VTLDDRQVSIDEFHGRLRGLLMAEVELGIDDPRVPMPAFATRDVTNDNRFAGGALAFASDEDIDALIGREASGRHGSSSDFDSDRS
jgi:CYTH domain-containing protein